MSTEPRRGDTIITSRAKEPSTVVRSIGPRPSPNTDEAGSLVERARMHFVVSLKATAYHPEAISCEANRRDAESAEKYSLAPLCIP